MKKYNPYELCTNCGKKKVHHTIWARKEVHDCESFKSNGEETK